VRGTKGFEDGWFRTPSVVLPPSQNDCPINILIYKTPGGRTNNFGTEGVTWRRRRRRLVGGPIFEKIGVASWHIQTLPH
jgi:hypothetical protein